MRSGKGEKRKKCKPCFFNMEALYPDHKSETLHPILYIPDKEHPYCKSKAALLSPPSLPNLFVTAAQIKK
jgi:hypothetical protein